MYMYSDFLNQHTCSMKTSWYHNIMQYYKHFLSPVIVHDGVESMSNSDDSALTELTPDGFLNEVISFQVHSSCGFIQH